MCQFLSLNTFVSQFDKFRFIYFLKYEKCVECLFHIRHVIVQVLLGWRP